MVSRISPFAPLVYPVLPKIDGVSLSVGFAQIVKVYHEPRNNFVVIKFDKPASVAGVYTRNLLTGPNITHCRQALKRGLGSAIIFISGNANVANGERGIADANEIIDFFSTKFSCPREEVFLLCTGTIGIRMPMDNIRPYMSKLADFSEDSQQWSAAAKAIMTSDTYPKICTRKVLISGEPVVINGIAKGAGMINPNMATTLSCVVTNARISSSAAQLILSRVIDKSFNCIIVDNTSTSDGSMLFATNSANNPIIEHESSSGFDEMASAIADVYNEMARMVVRDAEGITRSLTATVSGATSFESARKIAKSFLSSLLYKTSTFAGGHNVGKIATAIGTSGEPVNIDKLRIEYNGIVAMVDGCTVESESKAYFNDERIPDVEINYVIDVGVGDASATVMGSDLGYAYIDENV